MDNLIALFIIGLIVWILYAIVMEFVAAFSWTLLKFNAWRNRPKHWEYEL